jgi:hypothetical protein
MGVRRLGLEKPLAAIPWPASIGEFADGGVWVTPIDRAPSCRMVGEGAGTDLVDAVSPTPPGKETLWMSSNFGVVRTDVDDRDIIHPIARVLKPITSMPRRSDQ